MYDVCCNRFSLLLLCTFYIIVPPSADYLLLRDLQSSSCLPGKIHGLSSQTQTSLSSSMTMIGRGGGGGKGSKTKQKGDKTGAHSGKTLQKLGFGEPGVQLVLQLLELPQGHQAPGRISVWVQNTISPVREGSSMEEAVCEWPPREVVISGGTTPSFGHLRRPLATAFDIVLPPSNGGGPVSMQIYKYATETFTWTELLPGLNNLKKKGGRNQAENILSPPYNLKDGSFLILRTSSASASPVKGKLGSGSGVDRREDMFLRFLREIEAEEKKVRRDSGRSGLQSTGKNRTALVNGGGRKETDAVLRIGDLDLNFSDDDD